MARYDTDERALSAGLFGIAFIVAFICGTFWLKTQYEPIQEPPVEHYNKLPATHK